MGNEYGAADLQPHLMYGNTITFLIEGTGTTETTAKSGKTTINQLTNKPFTPMGANPTYVFTALRKVPQSADGIFNILTGVGSQAEATTKKVGGYVGTLWEKFRGKR